MAKAMTTLEGLIEEEFALEKMSLRVLESNNHAIRFYEKLDYSITDVTPLIEIRNGENVNLVPGTPPIDNFMTMSKSLLNARKIPDEILTAGPSISNREINYVQDAVSTGWNYHHSDYIDRFENSFAEYVGSKYAMATSSCSGALHLALLALGIGPGDEVIVPDVTWVATASAVMYTGAKPVFADINVGDWTINPDSIKGLINKKTKAIMPVHLYGYGAAMTRIMEIARDNNLHVVEDAAPAIGTEINMKRAGTFGDFGCFSFQGAKLLVTGEGGMLVTDNEDLYKRAKKIQDHGRKPGTFWIDEIGHKYKMSNVTAALGLAQIERAENLIFRKRRINRWYTDSLSDIETITFQSESPGTRSIYWMNSFTLNDELIISRDELIRSLKKDGIDSRPVFPAISQYPIWKYEATVQPNAKKIGATGINLPSGVLLSKSAIEKVCMSIRKAILS
jgi:perosamine synthetase